MSSPNSSDEETRARMRNTGGPAASTETVVESVANAGSQDKKNVLITTIGLAIHSLADGAALGASLYLESFGESQGLGMIIFIAIMLHKAPASLGFGTFLQHQGCTTKEHLKHLMVSLNLHPFVSRFD